MLSKQEEEDPDIIVVSKKLTLWTLLYLEMGYMKLI